MVTPLLPCLSGVVFKQAWLSEKELQVFGKIYLKTYNNKFIL